MEFYIYIYIYIYIFNFKIFNNCETLPQPYLSTVAILPNGNPRNPNYKHVLKKTQNLTIEIENAPTERDKT